jgi:hypothetical protein
MHPVFGKACVLKNKSKDDITSVVDHFYTKGDFHRNRSCIFKHLAIHSGRTSSSIFH